MPPLPTLVCKECGFVNEGERVYCHGCGAKLDRDVIAAVEKKAPSMEEKRREVEKIMSPKKGMLGRGGNTPAKVLALAALAAMLVCAAHAPQGAVPLDAKRELAETPPLAEMVEGQMLIPAAQCRSIAEDDINAYLRNERFRKVPSWFTSVISLQRVYVSLERGEGRLTVGGTLFGLPLYAGWTGYFEPGGGGLEAVCTGGFIGRLPIHPKLAEMASEALPMVVSSADRDWKLIRRLQSVQFLKQEAVFTTRPAPVMHPKAMQPKAPATPAPVKPFGASKAALPSPANRFGTPAPLQGGFH